MVGRHLKDDSELAPFLKSGNIVSLHFTQHGKFLELIESSRALWTPNVADASPRVLAQALCKNTPILVNKHIAGGWKYVNEKTGVFFSDKNDIVSAVKKLFSSEYQVNLSPRQYYMDNFGFWRSALYIQAFLEVAVGKERLEHAKNLTRDSYYEAMVGRR